MKKHSILLLTFAFAVAVSPFAVSAIEDDSVSTDRTGDELAITSTEVERSAKMEQRRAEAKAKLEARIAGVEEKLDQKRQELCEKRETRINAVVDKRVVQLQKHLDKFNMIRDRFVQFVENKELDVTGAADLESVMNDKQAAAQAAIDAVSSYQFSCDSVDKSNPGGIAKISVEAAKTALKDYRTAIKDYAKAARDAAKVAEGTTETETDNSAEGGTQ